MSKFVLLLLVLVASAGGIYWAMKNRKRLPAALADGRSLPDIELLDDRGEPVSVASLRGKPAVIILLRGSWCPFCNSQVKDLTRHYREVSELGAALIFVTPKPLDTTRRVAEIFDVNFTFWVDPELAFGEALGLRAAEAVPRQFRDKFGPDALHPTSIVIDPEGIIRFASSEQDVRARPDPELLVAKLRAITGDCA